MYLPEAHSQRFVAVLSVKSALTQVAQVEASVHVAHVCMQSRCHEGTWVYLCMFRRYRTG